jgi:hypothetical protein
LQINLPLTRIRAKYIPNGSWRIKFEYCVLAHWESFLGAFQAGRAVFTRPVSHFQLRTILLSVTD